MLEELGCDPAFINSIRGPVGLPIGAKNPAEIALAIVGEVLSESAERSGALEAAIRHEREVA